MNKRTLFFALLVLLGFFVSPMSFSLSFFDPEDPQVLKKTLLESFSDEEKVGQLFLITYPGNEMTEELRDWIQKKHLGGIKIFGWNAVDITKLVHTIDEAKTLSKKSPYQVPLIISTDQEGGWVQHIKDQMSFSVGNLGLSATNSPWESYQAGYHIGRELRMIGVNMNFAPTVDLYTNYNNLVIGPRSFSADPRKTAIFALAYYKGLKEARVIATAKHFPGHGEATEDSHGVLPQVNLTKQELFDREFIPYQVLIEEGIPAIMGGHLLFPKISQETSSLSSVFLQDILREELGFKGIVVTDDLIMGGASVSGLTSAQISEKAIRAGNTLLLGSMNFRTLESIRQHFLSLMRRDASFRALVEDAVERNLEVKLQYLSQEIEEDLLSPAQRLGKIPLASSQQALQETALRSVTLIRNEGTPVSQEKRTLLISTYFDMVTEGRRFFPRSDVLRYSYVPLITPSLETLEEIKRLAPYYEQIIFNLTTPASVHYLQALRPWVDKLTVISSLSPILLEKTPWIQKCLIVYGINAPAYRAGFWALLGAYTPSGELPLDIQI